MVTLIAVLTIAFVAGVASADWDEGDDYKMHYPQLPDPNGWDVSFINGPLGDDWKCTDSGPVDDIHMWVSFRGDVVPDPAETIVSGFVEKWSHVPAVGLSVISVITEFPCRAWASIPRCRM